MEIRLLTIALIYSVLASALPAEEPAFPATPAFKHRGFYLHQGWFFNHPFAVRTWEREDYAKMFQLLRKMGFDQVGIWPMLETIPAPISETDAAALRGFRETIEDAQRARLECWLIQCPNFISYPSIAVKPWKERNPYPNWDLVRLDDPAKTEPFLAHRSAVMRILNNADAYVTIDGDPGGYPGAKPEDWLKVLQSDRATIDQHGTDPKHQRVIPWIWCGWGTKSVWAEPIEPFVRAELKLIKERLPEPWDLLSARSHRDGHANGRVNIALAEELGLIPRSTILCYEAVEFEPTPPAAVLQFDIIRKNLKEESKHAASAQGVFGNAQQPVLVLPNLYFFARGSWDLSYLDKTDDEVLRDFATLLGGPPEVLAPAWSCLQRGLDTLPADLPVRLRDSKLGPVGDLIPGGASRYLDILARQVESRLGLLQATASPATSDEDAAGKVAAGAEALILWWKVHHYVIDGGPETPFGWNYVQITQLTALREWCAANVKEAAVVTQLAARLLVERRVLSEEQSSSRIAELLAR